MAEKGKISVLMGIYNCENTLGEAIESILNQTYENWELILCDDCSTDGTYTVAKSYADRYPEKIILLKNENNSKLAFTLNHCLSVAKGEFVARMDGDDKCTPHRFEKQLNYLKSHENAVLCGTAMQRFDSNGKLGSVDVPIKEPDRNTPHFAVPFNHATIMAYKSVYDSLGGYTVCKRTVRGQDRDLWYRFFAAGYKGANTTEPLYLVREDEQAMRRRTFKVRWNSFKTDIIGYKMLGYPIHWYIKPVVNLMKAFVPIKVIMIYREWQTKKMERTV